MIETSKKRISFFLTSLYGGGGERVVLTLARGLAERGYAVDIVLMQKKGPMVESVPESVRIVNLEAPRILASIPKFAQYVREDEPHAVMAISEHAHIAMLLAKWWYKLDFRSVIRIGIPLQRMFAGYTRLRDKLIPFLAKWLYPKADILIANSDGLADETSKYLNISRECIQVVYNPIDIGNIWKQANKPAPHSWLEGKAPIILTIGRLHPQKDFKTLIQAFAHVREQIEARLIILGRGNEKEALEQEAKELGVVEDVLFAGFQENPYAWLARADVFTLTSQYEGMPSVILEAMALGVPVVAADCSYGPKEILVGNSKEGRDGQYGMLVPIEDLKPLAENIVQLLTDSELYNTYSARGKERAYDFSVNRILTDYEKIYVEEEK